MARISWRSDVLGCGGVTPNPMMSSFNRQCRLRDSKVIRLALCSLPLNGDGKRLWLTNSLLPLHSAVFSCLWYFHSVQGDFWLTYRKQPPLPIILGTKTQSARLAETTDRSVTCYCAAQRKDGQWKAGLRWDFIRLIHKDHRSLKTTNADASMILVWIVKAISQTIRLSHGGQSALYL